MPTPTRAEQSCAAATTLAASTRRALPALTTVTQRWTASSWFTVATVSHRAQANIVATQKA